MSGFEKYRDDGEHEAFYLQTTSDSWGAGITTSYHIIPVRVKVVTEDHHTSHSYESVEVYLLPESRVGSLQGVHSSVYGKVYRDWTEAFEAGETMIGRGLDKLVGALLDSDRERVLEKLAQAGIVEWEGEDGKSE